MIKNDFVSLARVPFFDGGAYGVVLNDKCTAGFIVVGYDSDDMQFRIKVRCELVDVIAPPKFKVGDKVTPDELMVFIVEDIYVSDELRWRYGIRCRGNEHYYITRFEETLETA